VLTVGKVSTIDVYAVLPCVAGILCLPALVACIQRWAFMHQQVSMMGSVHSAPDGIAAPDNIAGQVHLDRKLQCHFLGPFCGLPWPVLNKQALLQKL
jgi:hypothetical protein